MTDSTFSSTAPSLSRRHLPALDGVRGLAILLVLLHHFTPAATGGTATTRGLLTVLHTGWIGVDLFFVLSGFLITGILLDTRGQPGYYRNFFARRLLRIAPLYYGTLAVLFGLVPLLAWSAPPADWIDRLFGKTTAELRSLHHQQHWLWLYLTNLRIALDQHRWGVVNHFWSLAVEEHFYLFWPIVVHLLGARRLRWVCLGLIAFAPTLRATCWLLGLDPVVSYVLTPCRLDSLAFGALSAILLRDRTLGANLPRITRQLSVGVVVLLLALAGGYGRFDRDDPLVTILGFSLLGALFAAFTLSAATAPTASLRCRLLSLPWLIALGRYSYGIYVLHHFLIAPIKQLLPWSLLTRLTGSYLAAIVLHALAAILVSHAVAWVVYHLFEVRFLRLKRYFTYPTPATPPLPVEGEPAPLPAATPTLARAA